AFQAKFELPITGVMDPATRREIILEVVKANLRPELFNRLDEVVCFDALNRDILKRIVLYRLDQLGKKIQEDHNASLDVDTAAVTFLAQKSYDPAYGARPVERTLQRLVLAPLSLMIIGD